MRDACCCARRLTLLCRLHIVQQELVRKGFYGIVASKASMANDTAKFRLYSYIAYMRDITHYPIVLTEADRREPLANQVSVPQHMHRSRAKIVVAAVHPLSCDLYAGRIVQSAGMDAQVSHFLLP